MVVKIVKNKDNPESTQILAEAILKISKSLEKLSKMSGLNEQALIVLIHDNCGAVGGGRSWQRKKPTKKQIKEVLKSMKTLKGYYLRKSK